MPIAEISSISHITPIFSFTYSHYSTEKTGLGHLYPVIGTEFYVPHSYEGLHLAKVKSGFECLVDPSRKYQGCWPLSEQLAT